MKKTISIILAALIALTCVSSAFAALSPFKGIAVGDKGKFAGYDWVVYKNDGTYAYIITANVLSETIFGDRNSSGSYYILSNLRKKVSGYYGWETTQDPDSYEYKMKHYGEKAEETQMTWAEADGGAGYITKHDMSNDVFNVFDRKQPYEDLLYILSEDEVKEIPQAILKLRNEWWLRTPRWSKKNDDVAIFTSTGEIHNRYIDSYSYIRPALQINLKSPLFPSYLFKTTPSGKTVANVGDGFVKLDNTYNGENGWKQTVIDKDIPTPKISLSAPASGEAKLIVEYEGARTGSNMYLSALLYDEKGNLINYAKVADTSQEGSGKTDLPLENLPNGAYNIKFFSEQINSDSEDDYASKPKDFGIKKDSWSANDIEIMPKAELLNKNELPKSIENVNVTQTVISGINLDNAEITGAQNVTEAKAKTTLNMTLKYSGETAGKETAKFEIQLGEPLDLDESKKLAVFLQKGSQLAPKYAVFKAEYDKENDILTFAVPEYGKYFESEKLLTVTVAEINGDAKIDGENKSSSGCNAGFGMLALLSLAGILVRKKH